MKLPVEQRPSVSCLEKQCKDSPVSSLIKYLFVDLQNDCSCDVEKYENPYGGYVLYLSSGKEWKVKYHDSEEIIHLPMIRYEEIDENIVSEFWRTLVSFGHSHSGSMKLGIDMMSAYDMIVEEGQMFFVSSHENLGVISANVGKIGVCCFLEQIKIE